MKHKLLTTLSAIVIFAGLFMGWFAPMVSADGTGDVLINQNQISSGSLVNGSGTVQFSWVDQSHISATFWDGINGSQPVTKNFLIGDGGNGTGQLEPKDWFGSTNTQCAGRGGCTSTTNTGQHYTTTTCGGSMSTISANPFNSGSASIDLFYYKLQANGSVPSGVSCQESNFKINIGALNNADIIYSLQGNSIVSVGGGLVAAKGETITFTSQSGNPNLYLRTSGDSAQCEDRILVDNTGNTATLWELTPDVGTSSNIDKTTQEAIGIQGANPSCSYNQNQMDDVNDSIARNSNGSFTIHVANLVHEGTPGTGNNTSNTTNENNITLTCNVDLNPLTWLICPIVTAANELIGILDTQINNLLYIDCSTFNAGGLPTSVCSSAAGQDYYQAWSSMRDLALGIVVIIGLVMVITQAMGIEAFDAYTVKKVLPRMLVAVIGISLSWQIIQLLVQLSNDIGVGIRWIIYQPFVNNNCSGSVTSSVTLTCSKAINVNQTGASALGLVAGISLLGLGLIGLLSFVLTAALAVIVAFGLLTFRVILIIFLAIFAPLAIAMYILPGTNKVWKFWWENFSKLLIMFPIISGMIAMGRVFALVTTSNGSGGVVQQITAMVAYFGPYFLIPMTFRWAGGLMSATANGVTRLQKSLNAPLSNFRKGQPAKQWQKAKTGDLIHGRDYLPGTTRFARRFGAITRGVATGPRGGWGVGARGEQGIDQAVRAQADEIARSTGFRQIANYDDALWAAANHDTAIGAENALIARNTKAGMTEAEKAQVRSDAHSAVMAVKASGYEFGNRSLKYASAQAAVATGTTYKDLDDMASTFANAASGNTATAASLSGFGNALTKQQGRWDLAPGFGNLNKLVQGQISGDYGKDSTGRALSRQEVLNDSTIAATRGADAVTALRGKPAEMQNFAYSLRSGLIRARQNFSSATNDKDRNSAKEELTRLLGQVRQLDANKSYASAENQKTVIDLMGSTTYRQSMDWVNGQPDAAQLNQDINTFSAPFQRGSDVYNLDDRNTPGPIEPEPPR